MKLTCKEASRLVSQGLDRRLGWYDRLRLSLHLKICDACVNFKNQMAFLRKAMARLVDLSSKP
jgi:predicted anti-sigma-YlaC factor YlaD